MAADSSYTFRLVCAACTDDATLRVMHPTKGPRTVCDEHARDYEVIERV